MSCLADAPAISAEWCNRRQFFFCSLSLVVSELFCNFAASKAFPLLTPAPSSVSAFAILLLSGRAFFDSVLSGQDVGDYGLLYVMGGSS